MTRRRQTRAGAAEVETARAQPSRGGRAPDRRRPWRRHDRLRAVGARGSVALLGCGSAQCGHGSTLVEIAGGRGSPALRHAGGIQPRARRCARSSGQSTEPRWPPGFTKLRLAFEVASSSIADGRRLGRIRLRQDPATEPPIAGLGFDALRGLPGAGRFRELARERAAPVKALLLDQSFAAGVGNWIADEVLYQARIAPRRRPVSQDVEADRCARSARSPHGGARRATRPLPGRGCSTGDGTAGRAPRCAATPSAGRRSPAAPPPGCRPFSGDRGVQPLRRTLPQTAAKARTGKVPSPSTFTGTAKNRNPASGTRSSPQRCSTMGMSAPRSVLCASGGGRVSRCSGSRSDQSRAVDGQPLGDRQRSETVALEVRSVRSGRPGVWRGGFPRKSTLARAARRSRGPPGPPRETRSRGVGNKARSGRAARIAAAGSGETDVQYGPFATISIRRFGTPVRGKGRRDLAVRVTDDGAGSTR